MICRVLLGFDAKIKQARWHGEAGASLLLLWLKRVYQPQRICLLAEVMQNVMRGNLAVLIGVALSRHQ